jgi:hypothetical protein
MGGTYEFVKNASANLREKDDHYNVALGGFFSGAILGLRGLFSLWDYAHAAIADSVLARTFPALLGYGAALATVMGAFEFTGGTLWGKKAQSDLDEFDRRTQIRKAYRTPAEQTFAELGEGRGMSISTSGHRSCGFTKLSFIGIYGPGYAERRAERLKETYGIEVPTSAAPAS